MSLEKMRESNFWGDFPTKPIGGGNPYYCCAYCKRSVPEINYRLEGHFSYCPWAKAAKEGNLRDDGSIREDDD